MLKRRYVYVLLFSVPALLVSVVVAAAILAASAGALWLFLLGDDPWPPVASALLGAVSVLGGVTLWLTLLSIAWAVGRRQESRPMLSRAHVALAIGATVVLTSVFAGRLIERSRTDATSDSLVCADFCRTEGFMGSGTPPPDSNVRTCSCYDAEGRETRRIDLSSPGAPPTTITR